MSDATPDSISAPGIPTTADPDEIARFSALSDRWWDPTGPFRPLHKFNPTRLAFLRERIGSHFERPRDTARPFEGLRLLDIGCGGGLLAEPMARLGASVTAIDASEQNIAVATLHARQSNLDIDYRCCEGAALAAANERFDIVLNMEVVEHVSDLRSFMDSICRLTAPGGIAVTATLNRTPKSFALAIVGAEYVLRWLPRGTHRWNKFVKPSELDELLRHGGMTVRELTGVTYNPLTDAWRLSRDIAVNYMMVGTKPA